jgi:hypothetical protein
MGWLIAAGYVAVWLGYGWRLTVYLLDAEVRRTVEMYRYAYDSVEDAADSWRAIYMFAGFALAAAWPIVLPVRGLYRLVSGKGRGLFVTPIEKQDARDRELAALRKQARDMGLPMPDIEETRHARH